MEPEVIQYVASTIDNFKAFVSSSNLDYLVRIIAAVSGLTLFIHFTCKAAFLPKSTPSPISVMVSLISSFGVFTFVSAVYGQCIMLPMALSILSVTIFDLSLWLYGFKLCDFLIHRGSRDENCDFNYDDVLPRDCTRAALRAGRNHRD